MKFRHTSSIISGLKIYLSQMSSSVTLLLYLHKDQGFILQENLRSTNPLKNQRITTPAKYELPDNMNSCLPLTQG